MTRRRWGRWGWAALVLLSVGRESHSKSAARTTSDSSPAAEPVSSSATQGAGRPVAGEVGVQKGQGEMAVPEDPRAGTQTAWQVVKLGGFVAALVPPEIAKDLGEPAAVGTASQVRQKDLTARVRTLPRRTGEVLHLTAPATLFRRVRRPFFKEWLAPLAGDEQGASGGGAVIERVLVSLRFAC